MITTLRHTFADSFIIIRKKHITSSKRLGLLLDYLRIVFKRFLHGRVSFFMNHSREKIGGFTIEMNNYSDFYWTFREVFVHEDYYFHTDKKDPFIIDCGGNIGITTLYFKWLYPDAKIMVFEPMGGNFSLLRKNIDNLRDVKIFQKAVGIKTGNLKMFGSHRAATLQQEFNSQQNNEKGTIGEEIEIDLLSSYIKNTNIDFLKLDTEGAEADVLQELESEGKMMFVQQFALEYHRFSFEKNKLSDIIHVLEKNKFLFTFSGDFNNLSEKPKRPYFNFMLYAWKD